MLNKRQYAIGCNGCYVYNETPLLRGWEPCNSIPQLQTYVQHPVRDDIVPGMEWYGSKLPAEMLKKVLGTAHAFPHTETGYILCYNLTTGAWLVQCPEQSGSGGAVRFKGHEPPSGYSEIGTIHTHPNNLGAFWSGTDLHDQRGKYGIHIVFGLDSEGVAVQCLFTIFTPSGEYERDLDSLCEHVDISQKYDPDPEWVEVIKKQAYVVREPPIRISYDDMVRTGWKPGRRLLVSSGMDSEAAITVNRPGLDDYDLYGFPKHDAVADAPDRHGDWKAAQERYALNMKARTLDDIREIIFEDMTLEELKQYVETTYDGNVLLVDLESVEGEPDKAAENIEPLMEALFPVEPDSEEYSMYESSVEAVFADNGFIPVSFASWVEPNEAEYRKREQYEAECSRRRMLEHMCEAFVCDWIRHKGLPKALCMKEQPQQMEQERKDA